MLSQKRAGGIMKKRREERTWSAWTNKGFGEGAASQKKRGMEGWRRSAEGGRARGQARQWERYRQRGRGGRAFHYDSSPFSMPPSPPQQPLSPGPKPRDQERNGGLPWVRLCTETRDREREKGRVGDEEGEWRGVGWKCPLDSNEAVGSGMTGKEQIGFFFFLPLPDSRRQWRKSEELKSCWYTENCWNARNKFITRLLKKKRLIKAIDQLILKLQLQQESTHSKTKMLPSAANPVWNINAHLRQGVGTNAHSAFGRQRVHTYTQKTSSLGPFASANPSCFCLISWQMHTVTATDVLFTLAYSIL